MLGRGFASSVAYCKHNENPDHETDELQLFNGYAHGGFNFAIDSANSDDVDTLLWISCALRMNSSSHSNCNVCWSIGISKELTLGATSADTADQMSAS